MFEIELLWLSVVTTTVLEFFLPETARLEVYFPVGLEIELVALEFVSLVVSKPVRLPVVELCEDVMEVFDPGTREVVAEGSMTMTRLAPPNTRGNGSDTVYFAKVVI